MIKKFAMVMVCGLMLVLQACSNISPTPTRKPTEAATLSISTSTSTPIPTTTPTSTPTPIPLAWQQVSDGQEFPRDKIVALEIDPKNPDILYVHMENAGYYRSMDGGMSWHPVQLSEIKPDSLASALTDKRGKSEFSNTAPDGKKRTYRHDGEWYIYQDEGKTWRRFSEAGTDRSNAIAFDSSGAVYVFCGINICKFSPDAKDLTILGKPEIGADTLLLISPQDPKIIYAAGEGLAVSKDGGYSWSKLNNGLGNSILQLETGISTPNNILYLQVGDCNKNRPRSAMEQPLYRSMDDGVTWEFLGNQGCFLIQDADGQTMYRLATESDHYDPWIWLLSSNGSRWDKIPIPSAMKTLSAHLTQKGVLYGNDDQEPRNKYISENYGYTWEKNLSLKTKPCYGSTLQFLDTYRPMAIDPLNGNHVLAINDGRLLESDDSCNTTKAFPSVPSTSINSIAFDPNETGTLYAGTDSGAYISFDSGQTWSQINKGLHDTMVIYSIATDSESNVYATTPFGIYRLESK